MSAQQEENAAASEASAAMENSTEPSASQEPASTTAAESEQNTTAETKPSANDDEEYTEEEESDEDSDNEAVVDEITKQVSLVGDSDEEDMEEDESEAFTINSLDDETLLQVLSHLDLQDLVSASEVSRKWNLIAKFDSLWENLYNETNWEHDYIDVPSGMSWNELFVQRVKHEIDCAEAEMNEDSSPEEDASMSYHPYFSHGFEYKSQVDTILDKGPGNFTVAELIDVDDFGPDLRSGKERLLVHLRQPSVIKELFLLALSGKDDDDAEKEVLFALPTKRTPHVAFQTLASNALIEVIIDNQELLDYFFGFLDRSRPDCLSASRSGYFVKITEVLFEKFAAELVSYFKTREVIVSYFIQNIDDNFVMELLFKLVDCGITHQWLYDCQLIIQLVRLLRTSEDLQTQEYATQVLVNIFTLCQPWGQSVLVLDLFNNQEISTNILEYTKSEPVTGQKIKQGLSVLISVLNLITEDIVDVPPLMENLMASMVFFSNILKTPSILGDSGTVRTTACVLTPPFGSVRLGILELFVALVYTGYPIVVAEMAKHDIFSILLDVFFQYPWNNIVHHQILQIISGLLCGNDDDLMRKVLEECKLMDRIVKAFEQEQPVGYLGFLREIANELIKVTRYSAPIATLLEENDAWMQFVLNRLVEINEVNETPYGGMVTDEDEYYDNYVDQYDQGFQYMNDEDYNEYVGQFAEGDDADEYIEGEDFDEDVDYEQEIDGLEQFESEDGL